ncbi:MAG TPA: hypothetical protein VGK79_00355 [Gaiellaceae bacterium]
MRWFDSTRGHRPHQLDVLGELSGGERLRQDRLRRPVAERLGRVARDEQHRQLRHELARAAGERRTVQAGHHDVADEDVGPLAAGEERQRVLRIGDGDDAVTGELQQLGRDAADDLLVLDEQHGARARARCHRRSRRGDHDVRIERQANRESRALAGRARDMDRPAELRDDAVDGRQPEPCALADLLRREERVEDPGLRRLVHADAGVGDDQLDRAALDVHGDREDAAPGHRVARIHREIEENLLELAAVDARGRAWTDLVADVDVLGQQPAKDRVEALDDLCDIHLLELQDLPAREREQLSGQLGRAVAGDRDRVDVLAQDLALGHVPLQQRGVAVHCRHQVVEVVCDAAGELADRLHLLRLP